MLRRKRRKAANNQDLEVRLGKTDFRQGHVPSVRPGWE